MKTAPVVIGDYCLMPNLIRFTGRGDCWKLELAEEGDERQPAAPALEERKPYLQQ